VALFIYQGYPLALLLGFKIISAKSSHIDGKDLGED
jgi:hypothetical protein